MHGMLIFVWGLFAAVNEDNETEMAGNSLHHHVTDGQYIKVSHKTFKSNTVCSCLGNINPLNAKLTLR